MYEYLITSGKLPPALEPEEEQRLLLQLAQGREEARNKLVEHNLRLVVYIAKKFDNTGVEIEELISTGTIGLIKGVNTYRLDKNIKLATYISRCIENEMLMYLRRDKRHARVQNLEEALSVDWDGHELKLEDILFDEKAEIEDRVIEARYISKMPAAIKAILSEKEYTIIMKLYGFTTGIPQTQKEVAESMGISQSYVSRIENKALKKLRQKLDKNISEVEDYQKNSQRFNIQQIHPDLTFPIFRQLLALFPEKERFLYATYVKSREIDLKEKAICKKTTGGGYLAIQIAK